MSKTNQTPGKLFLGMLDKYGLNCNNLAKEIQCSQTALRLISLDKSRITTSIALRLGKVFNTKPEFWLLAQMNYDLAMAAEDKSVSKMLSGISKAEPAPKGKSKAAPVKTAKPKAKAKAAPKAKAKAKPKAKEQ